MKIYLSVLLLISTTVITFHLNPQSERYLQNDNCKVYWNQNSPQNGCSQCADGYFVIDKTCLPQDVPLCQSYYNNQNVCDTCVPKAFKNSAGLCQLNTDLNCQNSSPVENKCLICKNGYILVGYSGCPKICQPDPDICTSQEIATNFCAECVNLMFLNFDYVCIPITDTKCLLSNGIDNFCQVCKPGYYINSNGICGTQNVPNCATFILNKNKCSVCVDGYKVSNDGNCVLFVSNTPGFCKLANGNSCIQCQPNSSFNSRHVCMCNADYLGKTYYSQRISVYFKTKSVLSINLSQSFTYTTVNQDCQRLLYSSPNTPTQTILFTDSSSFTIYDLNLDANIQTYYLP